MVLNDWIRGKIPFYTKPPTSTTEPSTAPEAVTSLAEVKDIV